MRLSLRLKIVGGFSLMLLLIALLGWVTLNQFFSLQQVQEEVLEDAIPGLVVVDEIVRSYTAQSAAVRGALIGSLPILLAQYRSEVENAQFWESRAGQYFTSPEERALLTELIEKGTSFHTLVDEEVVPLAERGERSRASRVLGQDGTTLVNEIERLGGLLRDSQRQVVLQSEADVRAGSNRTLFTLAGVLAAALALGGFLAITLPRRLVANLSKLVDAARAIERGDFDQKVTIKTRDEVGELAQRFGAMQVGLKRLQQLALQDRELEIAASIQRNLLRRNLPHLAKLRVVPLQRQANLVGGDWYDVDVVGRSLTVAVGDASGKGIAAALMATVAISALRSERAMGAESRRVIEAANRALREATDAESFTTMLYITVDSQTGEARWLNMGHHSPFVLRVPRDPEKRLLQEPAARGFYLEGPRNRALGWFDDPGYQETVVKLEPGDRLVTFTDGFLEAKSADGEVFGEHRLAEAIRTNSDVPSEELALQLVEEVERFAAGKLDDDLTMLVIEFEGDSPSDTDEALGEAAWHSRR